MDTIYALASAQGRAGVSVIRISGPSAFSAGKSLTGTLPDPRKAATRTLRDHHGEIVDHALVVCFEGPRSFTGEDVVELHVHGSISVVQAVLAELRLQDDLRLAEPGEFTRRALENGKLDLAQVEGLADLIDAETEAQRKQAVRVFSGALGDRVESWRSKLIRSAALLEATIDFADEDVPVDVSPEVLDLLGQVKSDLESEIAGTFVAERIRLGFEVALVGPPNAGKSTLLNRLAGRDAAITSDIAGTTRDVIEVRMDLKGLPVTFLDTAGLRDSEDEIESIGVARAVERAKSADLRIFLAVPGEELMLSPVEDDLVLQAKADLVDAVENGISGKTGTGVSELVDRIQHTLQKRTAGAGLATHARHRFAMERAGSALDQALDIVARGPEQYDIAAEELRSAIRALEALVGRIDVENLLDEIFSSFCLGK
ncbi:tRNA uridine-5-carboxymethylaminomethyl(34) synthesis GTPase MnmE [Roseobacter sp.]|uniref:tRNA uridine-5-carboxymethylaminomethyl(34) synthesis GTPase MnmE n=1 Tax=Roseobacter sp. TaxID=1907202 RepID=UPI002966B8C0|nr:tRNA uridine-5-carboxymethylaminomethyl(34) synthesis GTPase MnmE [Roseobacter sp.]MDW3180525.1 tRNA uridine-5-carboxymethylaminomethyl(34) synthesis GTPase MnmE [Roseobacter sp.]